MRHFFFFFLHFILIRFQVTIELLMCRIDQEFALVSDLSIRAPKPSFEIPLENFDLLFHVISGIGSVELDGELNA